MFNYVITSPEDYDDFKDGLENGNIISVTNNITASGVTVVPGIYTYLNGQFNDLLAFFPGIRANHTIINTGDIEILPSFTLTNEASSGTVEIELISNKDTEDKSIFRYILAEGEVLTVNGYTKIFSSNKTQNPYAS